MWETSQGIRTLDNSEACLIREIANYLHELILVGIEINEPHPTDVLLFDRLQPTQQLMMLFEVTQGLLVDDSPPVTLTAINEATIYAMFRELQSLIEMEVQMELEGDGTDYQIRSMVLNAHQQHAGAESVDGKWGGPVVPAIDSTDLDDWFFLIECVADQILWDRDFEFEHLVADMQPEKATAMKHQLGIGDDYYTAVAPDVPTNGIFTVSEKLKQLLSTS